GRVAWLWERVAGDPFEVVVGEAQEPWWGGVKRLLSAAELVGIRVGLLFGFVDRALELGATLLALVELLLRDPVGLVVDELVEHPAPWRAGREVLVDLKQGAAGVEVGRQRDYVTERGCGRIVQRRSREGEDASWVPLADLVVEGRAGGEPERLL